MGIGSLTYEVPRSRPWNTFVAGLTIDLVGVLLLLIGGSQLSTRVLPQPIASRYHVTLIAPISEPMTRPTPPRRIQVPLALAKLETPKLAPTSAARMPPQPQTVEPPKPELPKLDLPTIAAFAPPDVATEPAPAKQNERIKTNVFGAARSETATMQQLPREVQTGGFGDPSGIGGQGAPKRRTVTVASVGSFELPSGPGKGNGTGGAHGVSGTIGSTGFGYGAASPTPNGRGVGNVMPSGFGDAIAPGGDSSPQRIQKKPDLQPVEIVYKPRPLYTPEARQLRLEGEVLLEVVFTASGSLHVNRVVKGLGHGLDDSALAAALRIQFRPARRDGQPYDCAALVHMVFELAD
jgi:TonB family protein